jgi:hypothetical protein
MVCRAGCVYCVAGIHEVVEVHNVTNKGSNITDASGEKGEGDMTSGGSEEYIAE